MQYKHNAPVFTPSGVPVGHIDRVVMNPKTREVDFLVIRKGNLFTEDKVVPVALIHTAHEDLVTLQVEAPALAQLPEFEEVEYYPYERNQQGSDNVNHPGAGSFGGVAYAPPYFWYPNVGASAWATPMWSGPAYEARTKENIPAADIALSTGASIITSDDKNVGSVEEVITHGADKKASHFVAVHGLISKTHKAIPVTWINSVSENQIILGVKAEMLDFLPEHHM